LIIDRCRDYEEFSDFYANHPMDDGLFSYDFIKNNPFLICAYDEDNGKLRAYANMYVDDNRLFLSGASERKNLPDNIAFIIKICDAFNEDIYADTDKKTARIVLNRAGFQRLTNNLYVRYKNG
jgi:hypothetical protein